MLQTAANWAIQAAYQAALRRAAVGARPARLIIAPHACRPQDIEAGHVRMVASNTEVFTGCVECQGKKGKQRYSNGSKTCAHGTCRRLYRAARLAAKDTPTQLVKRGRLELDQQSAAYASLIEAKLCFSVIEVFSVSFIDPRPEAMGEAASRNGVEEEDYDYYYLLRGGFANDEYDGEMVGTRWVALRVRLPTPSEPAAPACAGLQSLPVALTAGVVCGAQELMTNCKVRDVKKLQEFDEALAEHMITIKNGLWDEMMAEKDEEDAEGSG